MLVHPRKSPILLVTLALIIATTAGAQHDGHREAVIDMANERPGPALERLEKLFEKPESLWRGLRGAYARAGETVEKQGQSYRDLVEPETDFTLSLFHSLQGDPAKAVTHAEAALAAGVPLERFLAGPRDALQTLYNTPEFQQWTKQETRLLLHGPMLGHVTDGAASFWVRTAAESDIEVRVRSGEAEQIKTGSARSSSQADHTAVVRVEGLQPDTAYSYQLKVDGQEMTVASPYFRTYPRRGDASQFRLAFTACAGYAPEHERVWLTIEKQSPLALLMLGDNVYIDDPENPLTQRFCYYRRYSRPEWRQLVSGRGVYAIWDDHDFGDDDSFGGPAIDQPPWKPGVLKIFTENWNNPAYGGGAEAPGVWFDFHIGDVHFIMLDGRYYREPNGRFPKHPATSEPPSMLGPVQLAWLRETLANSDATFKVIASPVPWAEGSTPGHNKLDKWDGFLAERDAIFDFLHQQKISGVVLISGDRHRSDARRIDRENGYPLYDFMTAIPTNYHTHPVVDGPGHLFGYNKENMFGLLHFDTTLDDPKITFEIITIDNQSIWSHDLRLSELSE